MFPWFFQDGTNAILFLRNPQCNYLVLMKKAKVKSLTELMDQWAIISSVKSQHGIQEDTSEIVGIIQVHDTLYKLISDWYEQYKDVANLTKCKYMLEGLQTLNKRETELLLDDNKVNFSCLNLLIRLLNIQILEESGNTDRIDLCMKCNNIIYNSLI